ncbi:translocon at the outer membrane of chloroplasts 64 [Artemisia annua]|uniref:Translocon at the outer membrane of chloroplasts 64 n=1 Tax=Artemisia annua TaxID=35608 RepID=A0A2U1NM41_ARTAN|nr:translocon at the outer membrane of chloroplasts 64 [Artemisia annua]
MTSSSSAAPNLWVLLGLSLAGIVLMAKKFKNKVVKADFGAFVKRFEILPPPQPLPPKAPHPLTGLSFAVSDLFDIDGLVTGFGNPEWEKTHEAASQTSSVVSALVDGGATCVGTTVVDDMAFGFDIDGLVTGFGNPEWEKTHEAASQTSSVVSALVDGGATCVGTTVVDDMAFGISGENKHYGTPTNPISPARIPGGSCSGAAVAVAAKIVDFALGVDTVGGVRQPAGHCGIIGFRPSYGAVSHLGIIPIAASLDTVGWFAADPSILRRVGQVLLQVPFAVQRNPRNVIIADDCFHLSKTPIDRLTQVVIRSTQNLFGKASTHYLKWSTQADFDLEHVIEQVLKHEILGDYIASKVPSLKAVDSKKSNGDVKFSSLRSLANIMQLLRRAVFAYVKFVWHEFSHNHFEWISSAKPSLDPLISAQVHERLELTEKDIENFRSVKSELRSALNALLKDDGVLVIPTVSSPPPKLGSKELLSEDYLMSEFSLTVLASMSGCCQVTIPLGMHENYPVSVSLIARHGGDRFLLDTLQTMHASLLQKADEAVKSKSSNEVVTKEASAEIAKEKGNNAFKAKSWQKAIGFYSEAIKLNSNNATYFNNRAAAYLELSRHEFSHNHFEWISSAKPSLDPLISAQVHERLELTEKDIENFRSVKSELRSALNALLKDDGVLVIPTVSSPPPKLGSKELLSEDYLMSEFSLTVLASMSGCCQVTIPLGMHENYPVSVSLIARHGGDRFLLDTLQTMHASLLQKADEAVKSKSSNEVVTKEASAEIAKEKGNNAFKAKSWQKAIGFYSEAIKLNSNNATYFNNRAAAYLELSSFIQAEADCTKAIDLDKKKKLNSVTKSVSGLTLNPPSLPPFVKTIKQIVNTKFDVLCLTVQFRRGFIDFFVVLQNVKAYLRRGTAREMLGYYKEAIEGVLLKNDAQAVSCNQYSWTARHLKDTEVDKAIICYWVSIGGSNLLLSEALFKQGGETLYQLFFGENVLFISLDIQRSGHEIDVKGKRKLRDDEFSCSTAVDERGSNKITINSHQYDIGFNREYSSQYPLFAYIDYSCFICSEMRIEKESYHKLLIASWKRIIQMFVVVMVFLMRKMEEDEGLRAVECLRGRLLAERASIKAANDESDQIAIKA